MSSQTYKIGPNCLKLKQSPHQSFLNSQSSNPLYRAKRKTRSWFLGYQYLHYKLYKPQLAYWIVSTWEKRERLNKCVDFGEADITKSFLWNMEAVTMFLLWQGDTKIETFSHDVHLKSTVNHRGGKGMASVRPPKPLETLHSLNLHEPLGIPKVF